MCGIAGVIRRAPVADVLPRMLARIARRGPDGEGAHVARHGAFEVGLGHRRLAIIDLEGGRQPMSGDGGNLHITFNGEIYNFQTLRSELVARGRQFQTRSDTEVIVEAVGAWGTDALAKLRGMFAFALWNDATGELLLARDRAGIKPLFYAPLPDGGVAFASELGAILEVPEVARRLSRKGLLSYLFSDYAHPPETLIDGVFKLPPGHFVTWRDGALGVAKPYWSLRLDRPAPAHGLEETARLVWSRLGDAVQSQLIADVPVGVFLSGGLDSSSIAVLAATRASSRLRTFSIGFEDATFDESSHARAVARHLGSEHVEETLAESRLLDILDDALVRLDEPVSDHSILPTYLLAQLAAKHVKVVLGGDAGDELFGGYPTYRAHAMAQAWTRIPRVLRRGAFNPLIARLPAQDRYQSLEWKMKRFALRFDDDAARRHLRWMSNVDLPELAGALPGVTGLPATLTQPLPHGRDAMNRLLALDFLTYMPGSVLPKVDRATMAHGLEARPPMLDEDFVELAYSIPSSLKLGRNTGKLVLQHAARPHLPPGIVDRRKQGFSVPLARWLRGPLRASLEEALAPSPLWDVLDRGTFVAFRDAHLARRGDHAKALWSLIVLSRWSHRERVVA